MQDSVGKRFSQLYLRRGEPEADSKRMRIRYITKFLELVPERIHKNLAHQFARDLGSEVQQSEWDGTILWKRYFEFCAVRDLVDGVSLVFAILNAVGFSFGQKWRDEVNTIFREENLHYHVDTDGCVHYTVDDEFRSLHASAIRVIESSRYANSRTEFEAAYAAMDVTPPNGKVAIRHIFTAVEGLFRLMFNKAPRLGGTEIDKYLQPVITLLGDDPATAQASGKWLRSFKEWVEAAHFYRHEQGQEEPLQPPLPLAVALLSSGAVYLRWLAEIDKSPNS